MDNRLLAIFMENVSFPENGCWEWGGFVGPKGYGQWGRVGAESYVHRFAFVAMVGPISDGYEVDHKCFNRCCVNPDHLQLLTRAENVARIRWANGLPKSTHCKQGHLMTPDNVRLSGGKRRCKTCSLAWARNRDGWQGGVGKGWHKTVPTCPVGHPFDEANTYTDKRNGRHCRTCHRERSRVAWRTKAV